MSPKNGLFSIGVNQSSSLVLPEGGAVINRVEEACFLQLKTLKEEEKTVEEVLRNCFSLGKL